MPSVANGICARSSEVLPYGMTMAGSMSLADSSNDDIVPMRGCFFRYCVVESDIFVNTQKNKEFYITCRKKCYLCVG